MGASKLRGKEKNAKRRIIRVEIYCTYSEAVTSCLLQESHAVLIKEVNHFFSLSSDMWCDCLLQDLTRWKLKTLHVNV